MEASMSGLTRLKLERLRMESERLSSSMSKARLTAGKCGWFNSELTVLILLALWELEGWLRRLDGVVGDEVPELENPPVSIMWLVRMSYVEKLEWVDRSG